MELYGLLLIAGAGTFGAMLIAALIYVHMNHDGEDRLRWSEPNVVGCGPPQMIQATTIRGIKKPNVDSRYNPLAGLPETDPVECATERRRRLQAVIADTQSASGTVTHDKTPRPMPAQVAALPDSPRDKQRRTRLIQVIRDTQSKA